MRELSYSDAIREASAQVLAADSRVFFIGQGVWSPWYVGSTMRDLDKDFGRDRVIDSPVSENATTGAAIGAALVGMIPVVIHPRMDFMILAIDQIVNEAANWSYMFGGQAHVPMVIRAIINRGGEQGAQHAQALHAWLMHVPGLKVVMPSTPRDAKGLFISAIYDGNPVIYIDDRWLYDEVGDVPKESYMVPIGEGAIRRTGQDVTVVAISYMATEAMKAATELESQGISIEIIDPRSLKPLDTELIYRSVKKTGRLVIADVGWLTAGAGAEIAASVASNAFDYLKAPIERVALPDCPAPTSSALEDAYYPKAEQVIEAVRRVTKKIR